MRNATVLLLLLMTTPSWCQEGKWKNLLNGKDLSGWDTYIGPAYDSVSKTWGEASPGLNNDRNKVFSIIEVDGSKVLKVSGENFGGISTRQEFENYHLKLEFKWGEKKYHPKKTSKRDSGLLYHASGKHGADAGFWMRSQEFQIQEGDCGDYWGVAGGSFEIHATRKDSGEFVYNPEGKSWLFNEKSTNGRRCIKEPDAEKSYGEWNLLELYCFGDTAIHIVNGKVVMVLHHSAQLDTGKLTPLIKGKIQLQSEGAELFFRNIVIQSIKRIPPEFLR